MSSGNSLVDYREEMERDKEFDEGHIPFSEMTEEEKEWICMDEWMSTLDPPKKEKTK